MKKRIHIMFQKKLIFKTILDNNERRKENDYALTD
jgi:hypothetical protein